MSEEYTKRTGFLNGEYKTVGEIKIPIDNLAVNRGYGAFDFFGIHNGKPFYADRHIDRFFNTVSLLKLKIAYSKNDIAETVQKLIDINQIKGLYMKMFALPTELDHKPDSLSSVYIVPVDAPLYEKELYQKGASLITKAYTRFLPRAKSTNYLPMVYWYDEMEKKGAVDTLYLTGNIVRETSRGNVFIVKNNVIYTPEEEVLHGITRSVILEMLKKGKYSIRLEDFTIDQLQDADEVFLSSTTKKVMPIVKVDGKIIADGVPGELTQKLIEDFEKLQDL